MSKTLVPLPQKKNVLKWSKNSVQTMIWPISQLVSRRLEVAGVKNHSEEMLQKHGMIRVVTKLAVSEKTQKQLWQVAVWETGYKQMPFGKVRDLLAPLSP